MQAPDYDRFFRSYVELYNAALEGSPVIDNLRGCYAEYLVSASGTQVMGGENGAEYAAVLEKGFGFYRSIGVQRMLLRHVETRAIIAGHDLVKVFFTAEMDKTRNGPPSIDFDVTYLLQCRDSGPKIFAFISDDEMRLFQELGLVDAGGKPL